jgi:hypothetical protein
MLISHQGKPDTSEIISDFVRAAGGITEPRADSMECFPTTQRKAGVEEARMLGGESASLTYKVHTYEVDVEERSFETPLMTLPNGITVMGVAASLLRRRRVSYPHNTRLSVA